MNNIKKWIIILVIILLILIVSIIVVKIIGIKTNSNNAVTEFELENDYKAKNILEKEKNRNRYYAAKAIANKFIGTILDGGEESIYNMLEPAYIKEFQITENNVYEKLNKFNFENLDEYQKDNLRVEIKTKEIYKIEKTANITIYFIYGNVKNNITGDNFQYNLIIEMDSKNNTFYILPEDFIEKNNYDKIEKIKDFEVDIEEIEENGYNKFEFTNIDDVTVINDYLSDYKDAICENIENSYNLLNKEYRETRFENYLEYEEYIKNNMRDILSISIAKYKMNKKDENNEYICIDKNNNYYIFKENAVMDYTLLLDNYTIDSQEFLDKYKDGNSQIKVGMNVEKVIKALNLRDYKYIYDKLDTSFKETNFNTLDSFKQYMEQKYPSKYSVEYEAVREEAGVYVQPITLISTENNRIQNNIIMMLKDKTDFVMSFGIE